MNLPIIIAGFDPTSLPSTPTNAQLLQMVQAAHTASNIGVIIWSVDAPNVATYPDGVRCIWGVLDVSNNPTGVFKYYVSPTWYELVVLDGANLVDGSVTIDKLSGAGATAGDIIQRDAGNTTWILTSIPAAIASNTLPVAKLVTGTEGQVLTVVSGAPAWATLGSAWINAALANNSLAVNKLALGSARFVVRTNAAGTAVEYCAPGSLFESYEIPITSLATDTSAITATAGVVNLDAETGGPAYYFQITANVTDFNVSNLQDGREINVLIQQDGVGGRTLAWDAAIVWPTATAPTIATSATSKTLVTFKQINAVTYGSISGVAGSVAAGVIIESEEIAVPAAGAAITPITVPSKAKTVDWWLRCTDAGGDLSYVQYDEIPASACASVAGQDDTITFTPYKNATQIGISRTSSNSGELAVSPKGGGATNLLTASKWKLVCYYSL